MFTSIATAVHPHQAGAEPTIDAAGFEAYMGQGSDVDVRVIRLPRHGPVLTACHSSGVRQWSEDK